MNTESADYEQHLWFYSLVILLLFVVSLQDLHSALNYRVAIKFGSREMYISNTVFRYNISITDNLFNMVACGSPRFEFEWYIVVVDAVCILAFAMNENNHSVWQLLL